MTANPTFDARDIFQTVPYVEPDVVVPVIVAEVRTMTHAAMMRLNTSLEADATIVSE